MNAPSSKQSFQPDSTALVAQAGYPAVSAAIAGRHYRLVNTEANTGVLVARIVFLSQLARMPFTVELQEQVA